jgi:hypothetical protein
MGARYYIAKIYFAPVQQIQTYIFKPENWTTRYDW